MKDMSVSELMSLVSCLNGNKPKAYGEEEGGDIRIVVLQRGWVAVGRYFQDGERCRLENAAIIRNWGATKGLGEIAENGPTDKTILDKSPTIRFHELTVVNSIDCTESKWKKHL